MKYNIGDKIVIYQNSERTQHENFVGQCGKIIGYKSKDIFVKFNNGEKHFIYEHDIKGAINLC